MSLTNIFRFLESEISDFVIPLSVDRSQSFHVPYLYDNESRSIVLEEYLIVTKAPRVTAHGIEEVRLLLLVCCNF